MMNGKILWSVVIASGMLLGATFFALSVVSPLQGSGRVLASSAAMRENTPVGEGTAIAACGSSVPASSCVGSTPSITISWIDNSNIVAFYAPGRPCEKTPTARDPHAYSPWLFVIIGGISIEVPCGSGSYTYNGGSLNTTYNYGVAYYMVGYDKNGQNPKSTAYLDTIGKGTVTTPASCGVLPTVTITADGFSGSETIPYNTAANISWSSTGATSCTVSPTGWNGISGGPSTTGNLTTTQTYTATCTGLGGTASASVTVNVSPPPFNFALSNNGNITVQAGLSGSNTETATLTAGATQPVTFSVSGLPAGAGYGLSNGTCSPTCSTTITITTLASTIPNSYPITVTAVGGSVTRVDQFTLTVTSGPPPLPFCGDGILNGTEQCDKGSGPGGNGPCPSTCDSSCKIQSCTPLSVALNASPSSGPIPFSPTLTATVSGASAPTTNYSFWWNCTNPTTDVATAGADRSCGVLIADCLPHAKGQKCDGQSPSSFSVTGNYAAAGTFTPKVIVENGASAAESRSSVTATLPAPPPIVLIANATPTSGPAPLSVLFTGSASGGTGPYTYLWTFGDGFTDPTPNTSHTYNAFSFYTATLTVTDSAPLPATASKSFTITVSNPATLVVSPKVNIFPAGQTRQLTAQYSSTGGFPFTDVTADPGTIWVTNFLSIARVSNGLVTAVAKGTAIITAFHGGARDSATVIIQNAPPTITLKAQPAFISVGGTTTIQGTVSGAVQCTFTSGPTADPSWNALTATYASMDETKSYTISYPVTPLKTATYTITCTNSDGVSVSRGVRVIVGNIFESGG